MEKNSSGMIFSIDEIINSFCNFGFQLKIERSVDVAHKIKQVWEGVETPIIRKESVWKFTWDEFRYFTIFEVFDKGFFWSFGYDASVLKTYSENELVQMYEDICKVISHKFSKEELRDIKLNRLGI